MLSFAATFRRRSTGVQEGLGALPGLGVADGFEHTGMHGVLVADLSYAVGVGQQYEGRGTPGGLEGRFGVGTVVKPRATASTRRSRR